MPSGRASNGESAPNPVADDDNVERLSNEFKTQVDVAKARISERYGKLVGEARTLDAQLDDKD
jgi:hypothetical protein